MARVSRNLQLVQFKLDEAVLDRLNAHCKKFGVDRSAFIQLTLVQRVQELDEKEAYMRSLKSPSKTTRAGSVPTTSATGMQIEIKTPAPVSTEKGGVPEKLSKSFRRYCEYVEASEDAREYSMRLQICFDELKERAGDKPQDANAAFLALQDLLKQRKELQPKEVMSLPDDVPLDGDVED